MTRSSWPDDRLCRLVGIEIPIVQAPMAGSSTPQMARAVGEEGGLGSLACAALSPGALDDLLRTERSLPRDGSVGPLHLNFFAHPSEAVDSEAVAGWLARLSPLYEAHAARAPADLTPGAIVPFDEERCAILEAHRPEIVSFHFGLPAPHLVDRLKQAGVLLMSSATTVREARWLEEHGCDVVIAQGLEAGGHRGTFLDEGPHAQLGTLTLVPQVVDAVDLPVIAAGGIADGRGIAAAFALGASGAQLGTAFLFSREASVSPLHLEALKASGERGTAVTNVFSGRPARCVVNDVMREVGPLADDAPAFPLGFGAIAPLRAKAEAALSPGFSAHYCGQAAPLCRHEPLGAGELLRMLAKESLQQLA